MIIASRGADVNCRSIDDCKYTGVDDAMELILLEVIPV